MKLLHCLLIILLLLVTLNLNAQVFGTAQTLKNGKWSLGVNPVMYDLGDDEMGIFGHLGLGLKPGMDLGFKLGLGLLDETYFGLDLEWALRRQSPFISISAGGHYWGDAGIDGTFNLTFPVGRQVDLYTGLDMDVVFAEGNTPIPLWIPIGIDVMLQRKMSLLIEIEIDVNDDAFTIFGAGVNFYL